MSEAQPAHTKWLGSVPEGWEVTPLKFVATVFPSNVDKHSRENEAPVALCNYTDVYYNDIISAEIDFMKATATNEQIEKFRLRADDTIVTKDSESADDIGISAYVSEDLDEMVCGYHLSMIRPGNRVVGRFIKRLFDSHYVKAVLETSANGLTRVGLGQYALDNIYIPLPPAPLQNVIADFLDRETAKIDTLIDKQEQLVATLREDRAATITHAVTKGLDPQIELRDSGVRWMGAVPAHWRVDRIKNSIESAQNGVWGAEPDGGSEDIRCVRVADFDRPQLAIHDRDVTVRKVTSAEREGRILQRGNLLLEKSGGGDKNPVGFVVLYDKNEPAVCSNFVARVHLAPNQDPKFWTYVHHCLYQSRLTYRSIKQNTGIQNLDQQSYFNERAGFPPFGEQREIVDFLDAQCARIDSLIYKSTEMIETLREYRSALITNAVTGKIDVREAV
jgi:type I restriction enzyme S subunit